MTKHLRYFQWRYLYKLYARIKGKPTPKIAEHKVPHLHFRYLNFLVTWVMSHVISCSSLSTWWKKNRFSPGVSRNITRHRVFFVWEKMRRLKLKNWMAHILNLNRWSDDFFLEGGGGGGWRVVSIFCCASLVSGNRNKSKGGGGHYCTPSWMDAVFNMLIHGDLVKWWQILKIRSVYFWRVLLFLSSSLLSHEFSVS